MLRQAVLKRRKEASGPVGEMQALGRSLATITYGLDGTILRVNPNYLRLFGYSADEIVGLQHSIFVCPADIATGSYDALWARLRRGDVQADEYHRIRKDGSDIWIHAISTPVDGPDGRPAAIVEFATDITATKLNAADDRGQIAALNAALAVAHFDLTGIVTHANALFLQAMGYGLAEVRGQHHRMFVEPSHAASSDYAAFWADLGRGLRQVGEYKRFGKNGREIWLQASYTPILDMTGRPFKVVAYATDVTQHKLRQVDYEGQITAIRKSQCVATFAVDGTLIDANDNFLAAFGYRLDEVVGRDHRMFVEPDFADTDEYAAFWETLRSGSFLSAKFKRIGKDGRHVWIQASYNPILDLNGRPFKIVKIATDVTADVALAAKLSDARRQAEHDVTTSLPNRIRLAAFMASALAEPGARLAVLYMDLDHFKPINDTFGHEIGDHVLAETADRLRRALAPDQLVARVGGDEFVVAAPNLSDEAIETLCRRLITLVRAPIQYDGRSVMVGLSIGVSVSPGDGHTPDELLRRADVALYRSKGNGRGAYGFFSGDINARIAAARNFVEEMRHGIKTGQFFIEYQPRFNARTQAIQGVEALVRWAHPERGRIEPADFIPLADRSGLIVPLGEWVLRTACHAALAWPGIGISVNVSQVQFRSASFIKTVEAVLQETGLEAERLELEIAESGLLDERERTHAMLGALKKQGVRLALDDVAGGRSSVSDLRSFSIDTIKLDRRVMAGLEEQEGSLAIIQTVLGLGKALGVGVTVQGVETVGQLLRLNLEDCAEVQGFLLAKPMSALSVTAWLNRKAPTMTVAG